MVKWDDLQVDIGGTVMIICAISLTGKLVRPQVEMREVAKTRKLEEPARTDVKKVYECKFALSTHKLLFSSLSIVLSVWTHLLFPASNTVKPLDPLKSGRMLWKALSPRYTFCNPGNLVPLIITVSSLLPCSAKLTSFGAVIVTGPMRAFDARLRFVSDDEDRRD